MTKVPRSDYSESMVETVSYRHAACPTCGATTEEEAGVQCRPTQLPCGEWTCGVTDDPGLLGSHAFVLDAKGRVCTGTNKSRKKEARDFDEWVRAEHPEWFVNVLEDADEQEQCR